MTLEHIAVFDISEELVGATERSLRDAGSKGYELFVLWSGRVVHTTFSVEHIYVPTQQSYQLQDGLCVRVSAQELDRLNRWLYDHGQMLAAQVHTHPGEAYHSETDDTYPIVTVAGGLSIVAPYFCRDELGGPGTAVFRLTRQGWDLQPAESANELIQVIS